MEHNRNDGHNTMLQVPTQPNIGLDTNARHSLVGILNHALANEAVLTVKTRCAYWNVSGAGFFELRILFDSQYEQLNQISNEIAERVRILGGIAIGSQLEFINSSRLDEQPGEVPGIMDLLADHEAATRFLREDARKCIEEYEDEGTFEMLVSVMRLHERIIWMLHSSINPELDHEEKQSL